MEDIDPSIIYTLNKNTKKPELVKILNEFGNQTENEHSKKQITIENQEDINKIKLGSPYLILDFEERHDGGYVYMIYLGIITNVEYKIVKVNNVYSDEDDDVPGIKITFSKIIDGRYTMKNKRLNAYAPDFYEINNSQQQNKKEIPLPLNLNINDRGIFELSLMEKRQKTQRMVGQLDLPSEFRRIRAIPYEENEEIEGIEGIKRIPFFRGEDYKKAKERFDYATSNKGGHKSKKYKKSRKYNKIKKSRKTKEN